MEVELLLFLKGTMNAKNMGSNLRFDSVQVDQELTDSVQDNCTGIDDDFIAECSSAENSIHTQASTRKSYDRNLYKKVLSHAIDGKGTRRRGLSFLDESQRPYNKLPENKQMFLRMKIQEIIFQETEEHKRLLSCTDSRQMQEFGELNQTDGIRHLSVQSFFHNFSEW
jgi:hypothetical protein